MLLMGKCTISMGIFNSYVKLPEGYGLTKNWGFDHGQWDMMNILNNMAIYPFQKYIWKLIHGQPFQTYGNRFHNL